VPTPKKLKFGRFGIEKLKFCDPCSSMSEVQESPPDGSQVQQESHGEQDNDDDDDDQ
jgi:hypothetical protein